MATAAAITEQKWPFRLKSKANCGQISKQYLTLLFFVPSTVAYLQSFTSTQRELQ